MVTVLIADPDESNREHLGDLLGGAALGIHVTGDGQEALRQALELEADVVIADLELPGLDGLSLLRECRSKLPDAAVILVTAFGTVEDAVRAMREGASDFLSKPYSDAQIQLSVDRSLERLDLVRENQVLREALDDRLRLDNVVASDPRMHEIFKTVKAVASTRTTVLLTGESGTGKTLLARSLHSLSPRAAGPFIEVNCGALPESLLESELFGHVRGAFTGAVKDRPGKFEAADGGTIFLDEIGHSSPGFQVKLLRVLQDRVLERVGDSRSVSVDVRVVLATNLDLAEEVRAGRFREDLFYRINVITVEMPPLRDRPGDIPLLADHFLHRHCAENDRALSGLSPDALELLMRAPFPGNVRQLENVIERAVVLSEGSEITAADLPPGLTTAAPAVAAASPDVEPEPTPATVPAGLMPLKKALEAPERAILVRTLEAHGGNRQETARTLGINRSTLFNKMRKYDLL